MRSYEQALQRLALDTVDALVIHDLDAAYHGDAFRAAPEGHSSTSGMKALQELKTSGDIKAYGMGINTDGALETVAPQVDLDFVPRRHALHAARSAQPAHAAWRTA